LARVDAEGKNEDFQAVVTYSVVDESQEEVLGVSHAPATVRVSAEVELTKEVEIVANLTGDLLEGYALSSITLEPETIVIQGDPDRISKMDQVETVPINIDLLSQTTTREVQLDFPTGVHPNNGDQVVARIEVEPLDQAELEIQSDRVEFYQLEPGLRAFTESHVIHVSVQAPQSVIADLDQQDLRLYVNLQDFEAGVYKLPIQGVLLVDGQIMSLVPNEMEVVVVEETQEEPEASETESGTEETTGND
jgi:YbbR domain-containing protein